MTDLTIRGRGGADLTARLWGAAGPPRGVVLISHGLGEHGGVYRHVAEAISGRLGVDVLAHDYRGHGRSPGGRGYVRRYEELVDDLTDAAAWADRERPGLPRFLLGHSNGGQVAIRWLLGGGRADGLVLSNPTLRLRIAIPRRTLALARLLRVFAPRVTLGSTLRPELLTRDVDHYDDRRADALRHTRISAPLFFGMVEGGARLAARAPEIGTPTLVLLGEADPIVDPAATLAWFEALGSVDKALEVYPESLHEPLNDLDRDLVIDELIYWIGRRLAAPA